jgi:CheY-like chemotaxis protein
MSNKPRILAVDDEEDIRLLYESALEDSYEVFIASDGAEALAMLGRIEPDIVIADLMMPNMDGWELLQRIRTTPGYEETPVILVTALSGRDDMKKGYQTGATVYLTKPFDVQRLKKNVGVTLANRTIRPKRFSAPDLRSGKTPGAHPVAVEAPPTVAQPPMMPSPAAPASRPAPPVPAVAKGVAAMPATGATPVPGAPARPTAPAPPRGAGAREDSHGVPGSASGVFPRIVVPPVGPRPRVLIIEPEEEQGEVLRRIAESRGMEAIHIRDAGFAVQHIEELQPDLFVVEPTMPKMNGYQFMDRVRSIPQFVSQPALFVSARELYREKAQQLARNVKYTLSKPIRPNEFTQKLSEMTADGDFEVMPKLHPASELKSRFGRR